MQELGQGALSVVKCASHRETGRRYAVKVVQKSQLHLEDQEALLADMVPGPPAFVTMRRSGRYPGAPGVPFGGLDTTAITTERARLHRPTPHGVTLQD